MNDIKTKADKILMNTYGRFNILFDHGKGAKLYDSYGKEYIDLSSGIAVDALGHANKDIIDAVTKQMSKLTHISNLFYSMPMIELADKLTTLFARRSKAFFCNSGAEANEAALKLARYYSNQIKGNKNAYKILSFKDSFHGRTMATLSITGQKKYQKGFTPLLKGVLFAEINNISSVEKHLSERLAAIIIEPVQGESGVFPVKPAFLKYLRDVCTKYDIPLIFDEVQAGIGRTGTFFAFEQTGVVPDVITLAKGLAGGLPIGATLAHGKFADVFKPGTHASTFGGNPVSCAAANVVVDKVSNKKFLSEVQRKGEKIKKFIRGLNSKYVKEIRGEGLLIGVSLKEVKNTDIVNRLLAKGTVPIAAGSNTLRIAPPLIITDEELDSALEKIREVLL